MQIQTLIRRAMVAPLVLATMACAPQKFGLEPESEEFGQKVTYNTEVEVLWVIDTSSSMAKHQDSLAGQIGLFVDALHGTKLNYRIGVTTMDMGSGGAKGRFLKTGGQPAVLDVGVPGLTSVLAERLKIGEDGSPIERGLEAMKAALTKPNIDYDNAGFLREKSLLVVVFLSNEDDQSVNADYVKFLDDLRPPLPSGDRSWIAHFIGVTPDDPSCQTSEWNYSSPGLRYMALAEASGGVSESICTADLRRAVSNVKKRIIEVITEFPLDRKPKLDTIKVYVNGQLVPQDAENGWSYHEPKNSIRFHGTGVPLPDSSIRVDFDPEGIK